MSHMTSFRSKITNPELARLALLNLNLTILPAGNVDAMDGQTIHCDLRIDGNTPEQRQAMRSQATGADAGNTLGLARADDGFYSIVGDLYGKHAVCARLGDHFQYGNEGRPDFRPNLFEQKYLEQCALGWGQFNGYRLAAHAPLPNGDVRMEFRGGSLSPDAYIEVVALRSGDVRIEVFNHIGSTCKALTQNLEDLLGGTMGDTTLKPEYNLFHTTDAAGNIVHAG